MFAAKPMPVTDPVWTEDPVLQVVEHVHFPSEDYLVSYVFYIIYIFIYNIIYIYIHEKNLFIRRGSSMCSSDGMELSKVNVSLPLLCSQR